MTDKGVKYLMMAIERDKIIKTMIVGFGMGVAACMGVFSVSKPDNMLYCVYMLVLFGIALSGMPYMWLKLPKVYGIFNPVSWVLVFIKFIISTSIGFVYTPISLIVKTIQIHIYHRQVRADYNHQTENYSNYNSAEY